jgi:hypothetical protein
MMYVNVATSGYSKTSPDWSLSFKDDCTEFYMKVLRTRMRTILVLKLLSIRRSQVLCQTTLLEADVFPFPLPFPCSGTIISCKSPLPKVLSKVHSTGVESCICIQDRVSPIPADLFFSQSSFKKMISTGALV